MRQLAYLSTATTQFEDSDLKKLLDHARLNNRQIFVTGLLLFDGSQFLQVLEGDTNDVDAVFSRICKDPRHTSVSILSDRTVAGREFGNWSMANNKGEKGKFSYNVKKLIEAATCPSLKAKFSNFADYI